MAVVHLTGPAMELPDRTIQRCMVCGQLLINFAGRCDVWPDHRFLRVTKSSSKLVTEPRKKDTSCLSSVPCLNLGTTF